MRTNEERVKSLEAALKASRNRNRLLEGMLKASRSEAARLQAIVWQLLYPQPGLLVPPAPADQAEGPKEGGR